MILDLSKIINKIKKIEKSFNETDDPLKRYALIQALNHIAEKELPIHGWIEEQYYTAMIRLYGGAE
jgi:hypothetical protein